MKPVLRILCLLLSLGALGSTQTMPHPNPFKHIILVVQENRSPDELFQTLLTYPGINPANYDLASSGLANVDGTDEVITLTPRTLETDYDLGHSHADFELMYDNGLMDGANSILDTCNSNATDCENRGVGQFLSYKYVQASDIGPYLQLAAQYGWANYMFQTNQSDSYAAHQILFSGTSARDADDDATGYFMAGVPGSPKGGNYVGADDTGCLAPLGEVNAAITTATAPNTYTISNNPLGTFCFHHDSMASLLDYKKLTWKYYAQNDPGNPYPNDPTAKGYNPKGTFWNAANSMYTICLPDYDGDEPVCTSSEYANNIDTNPSDVLTNISDCKLPSVAWVTPIGKNSDHPGEENATNGPSWVASIVNAVGAATTCDGEGYWSDTAILVTWDDWGGWYDHVAPTILPAPQGDFELGFRVPLLVISAYTPTAYVDNQQYDFGSILRFMEGTFGFPEGYLGFADARADNDLSAFFNFQQSPSPFQVISAPRDKQYFLHQPTTFDPPDTY
jgi:phospholipase C